MLTIVCAMMAPCRRAAVKSAGTLFSAFQNSGSAIVLTADATTNFFCAEYVQ